MSTPLSSRLDRLPRLGLGISTEHGAADAPGALRPLELRRRREEFAAFLEVGIETSKGLDAEARAWARAGLPATYHFLDLNLDDPRDQDAPWLEEVRRLCGELRPAWLCGDAGLWHFGPRERGHMLLLPPVLSRGSADAMAEGVVRLREATGLEVLPENPPGSLFVGDLHILDFFARVSERAETGLLLDAAHLGMFQRARGLSPLAGLDGFPLDRVVELHVAGGLEKSHAGLSFVEDDHGLEVLEDTWEIATHVIPRAPNLRAVVLECERNPLEDVLPLFARVAALLEGSALAATLASAAPQAAGGTS